jgi:hypothetical protein
MIVGISVVTSEYDLITSVIDADTVDQAVHQFSIEAALLINPEDRLCNVGVEPLNQDDFEFAEAIQSALTNLFGLEMPE